MRPKDTSNVVLLTPAEAANFLEPVSPGSTRPACPPFIRIGRSIRYSQTALIGWMMAR
jgi:hypothetical protein